MTNNTPNFQKYLIFIGAGKSVILEINFFIRIIEVSVRASHSLTKTILISMAILLLIEKVAYGVPFYVAREFKNKDEMRNNSGFLFFSSLLDRI